MGEPRAIEYNGERLIYSHIAGMVWPKLPKRTSWSTPKVLEQRTDGTLRLRYWSGVDALIKDSLFVGNSFPTLGEQLDSGATDLVAGGSWRNENGSLIGNAVIPLSSVHLPLVISDFQLICTVDAAQCQRAALLFRLDPNGETAIAMVMNIKGRTIEIGPAVRSWMPGLVCEVEDFVRCEDLGNDKPFVLRVLVRDEYLEAYKDDEWIFTMRCPATNPTGYIGFAVEQGTVRFSDLSVSLIDPLP